MSETYIILKPLPFLTSRAELTELSPQWQTEFIMFDGENMESSNKDEKYHLLKKEDAP